MIPESCRDECIRLKHGSFCSSLSICEGRRALNALHWFFGAVFEALEEHWPKYISWPNSRKQNELRGVTKDGSTAALTFCKLKRVAFEAVPRKIYRGCGVPVSVANTSTVRTCHATEHRMKTAGLDRSTSVPVSDLQYFSCQVGVMSCQE